MFQAYFESSNNLVMKYTSKYTLNLCLISEAIAKEKKLIEVLEPSDLKLQHIQHSC